MATSHTNVKRRRTKSSNNSGKAQKRIAIAIVFCLAAISAYLVMHSLSSGQGDDSIETSPSLSSVKEPTDLRQFEKAYLEVNGGLQHLQSLRTLRLDGRITSGGSEMDFFLLKRRPDMMLMTYKQGQKKITFGSKDGVFWARQFYPGQPDEVIDVPEEDIVTLRPSVPLFGPLLMSCLTGGNQIETIELAEWEQEPALKVKMSDPLLSLKYQFYLDENNLHIIAQITTDAKGKETRTKYFDYEVVDRVPMPMRTTVIDSDGSSSGLIVKSVRFNVGASSLLFDR